MAKVIYDDMKQMEIRLHSRDLPKTYKASDTIAVDTETMGLNHSRDRLCLVQLSNGDGSVDLVQIKPGQHNAPRLEAVLNDKNILKIFHYARFDVAILMQQLSVTTKPVYCTKIASRLVRTYTDQHSLKTLCHELLEVVLEKEQQSSDWGAGQLRDEQLRYAAADVIYLHKLKPILDSMLEREGRLDMASECFSFVPVRSKLDIEGWQNKDIFAH